MRKNVNLLFSLTVLALSHTVHAAVVPAPLFSNNAVLQRGKPVPVWGTADAGEKVSVSFAGQSRSTTADVNGQWRVDLAPLPANAIPAELVIKGTNTITLSNILVGEVWLASGQSNMEYMLKNTYDAAIDIPASARYPLIRQIQIAKKVSSTPLRNATGTWQVAGPETTGGFSAVAYYFAVDVHNLINVPIGIIHSSWGGTRIEAWVSPDALKSNPVFSTVFEGWEKALAAYPEAKIKHEADMTAWKAEQAAAKAAKQPFGRRAPSPPWNTGHNATPAGLNNGMIAPLAPYALRGALWYQGEANSNNAADYHALFTALITGWRAQFAQGDFPFYWAQLTNYKNKTPDATQWAALREAQNRTLALPATGQAVILDIGDYNDIHPRNKKDVGRRLARIALAKTYEKPIVASGPIFASAEPIDTGFRVRFTEVASGLRAPLNSLSGFELAGADKVFKPAIARIEGETVIVSAKELNAPVAVRYAWRNAPVAGLFNNEGLPAAPFRSDTW